MAAINFVKGEQYYTAEFQINGPVNVHIERAEAGALYFRQRSIDHGSYDLINGANWNNRGDLTIDTAIQGVVYPMWIKIESASEPTLAEMVEGEQSGGGAGESGGAEPTEYYSINWTKLNELGYTDDDFNNNASSFLRDAVFSCSVYKIIMQGNTRIVNINEMWQIVTLLDGMFKYSFITAIAFTPYTQLTTNTYISSLKDIWNWVGQPFDEIFTPITKEQFYNLEA